MRRTRRAKRPRRRGRGLGEAGESVVIALEVEVEAAHGGTGSLAYATGGQVVRGLTAASMVALRLTDSDECECWLMGEHPFFCFDLDGTVLAGEVLPALAREIGLEDEMRLLTGLTMQGLVPFEASFRLRCRLLREVPLARAQAIVAELAFDSHIAAFIQSNPQRCAIVTNNLDVWVGARIRELGCAAFTSEAFVIDDAVAEIASILDKGAVIDTLRSDSEHQIIAIGDGANDIPMLQRADIGIAFAGLHPLPADLIEAADHVAADGAQLVRMLEGLVAGELVAGAIDREVVR